MNAPLLTLDGITRRFTPRTDMIGRLLERATGRRRMTVHAVDAVSLTVAAGEIVGLVGESGSGKSTIGRMAAGLLAPSDGRVLVDGVDRAGMSGREALQAGLRVQMVFQDPMASLNPRHRIGRIVGEAAVVHGRVAGADRVAAVEALLQRVGLDPAMRTRFPHELSGGQRQRVGIARALSVRPDLLVCDEAVAALDVSIQAQILNLFLDLREQLGLGYLFVSHDLGVVRHLADRVVVLNLGRVVEQAPAASLFARPQHPYTQILLASMLEVHGAGRRFVPARGDPPSPTAPPPGCSFHPRCPRAVDICKVERPALRQVEDSLVACHLPGPPAC